jgi:hypothetical protein
MATCYRCGAEIPRFEEGLPVCEACSEILSEKIMPKLKDSALEASTRLKHSALGVITAKNGK